MKDAHAIELVELIEGLGTDPQKGLSHGEAKRRLARFGENCLSAQQGPGPVAIFLNQFSDFMVLVLMGAALLSGWLGEWSDAVTILSIVVLNAVLGFIQEYRAEKSLAALRRLSAPTAKVKRGGRVVKIPAAELVPGDLVLLSAGDGVPADLRLISGTELEIDESTLTGESMPVHKYSSLLNVEVPLAERSNMAWMGTLVTKGDSLGLVVATGMETQMGQIASLLGAGSQETPLEKRLAQLGKYLVLFCGAVCGLVVALGLLRGEPVEQMVMIGISLAVAAIPEGLPAIVTIALALGVQRMSQRRAIVRQLPAVETLGCVSVICADKTGTLTANALTVQALYLAGRKITVSGIGYEPVGDFYVGGRKLADTSDLQLALRVAVLCNKAELRRKGGFLKKDKWERRGDPTEVALLALGGKGGVFREKLEASGYRQCGEKPFDSTRKMMSVLCRTPRGELLVMAKGAPEVILGKCSKIHHQNRILPLDDSARKKIRQAQEQFADEALRVLALAYRPWSGKEEEYLEEDLVFLGLVGMADHPREGVRSAIAKAERAGIRTVMITGDHAGTAAATANKLGMKVEAGEVWEEVQLAKLSPDELRKVARNAKVFARVTPKRKLDIVKALKEAGEIVAMTGDGVNDAPALQEAHVGVAMGRNGTDVAREAAEVVLTDDNFATIVAAIEEGRGIYKNIRKFIRYLLGCNVGEILVMLAAAILGLPAPLLPIQLLWLNLVTDGLPAMALGMEPPERELMEEPPRSPDEGIFSQGLLRKILGQGLVVGGGAMAAFIITLHNSNWDLALARTVAFSTLVFSQLAFSFRCRSEYHIPLAWQGNPHLLFSVFLSTAMQYLVLTWQPLAALFKTVPLQASDWLVVFFLSSWPVLLCQWVMELITSARRHWSVVKV